MGMDYTADEAERRRRQLRDKLMSQKEKERQDAFHINEFGEIVRDKDNDDQGITSRPDSDNNVIKRTFNSLRRFAQVFTTHQTRLDKVWAFVKSIFFAYLGAALSMILMPSWFSPLYYKNVWYRKNDGEWLFYAVIILIAIQGIGTYVSWILLKKDNENYFFRTSSITFKLFAGVWIVLSIIMLFYKSISAFNSMGVFCCIICVVFAYFKRYQCSKYIRYNRLS